jgi:hypothetical protein
MTGNIWWIILVLLAYLQYSTRIVVSQAVARNFYNKGFQERLLYNKASTPLPKLFGAKSMYSSGLTDFKSQLEKTVGVLDATGRKMSGVMINAAGIKTKVDDATVAFARLTEQINKLEIRNLTQIRDAFSKINQIRDARREMEALHGAMDRAAVTAKMISISLDFTRPSKLLADFGRGVNDLNTKLQGVGGALKSAFSSPESSIGNYRKSLLDFNRDLFAVSRISTTLGRDGVFSNRMWESLNKNTTLGRQSFVNLYRSVMENSRGLPMAAKQYIEFSKVISEKFGGSLDTVTDKTQKFLALQNTLPNVKDQMDVFRTMNDTFGRGMEPKGLRETIMLLGDLGADNKSLDFFAQYTTSLKGSEQALLRFENAVAKRNQSIENHNVKMGQSMEDTFINIDKTMTKLTDTMTEVAQSFKSVANAMAILNAAAPIAGLAGTGMMALNRAGMMMAPGGQGMLGRAMTHMAGGAPGGGPSGGLGTPMKAFLGTAAIVGTAALAVNMYRKNRDAEVGVAEAEQDVNRASSSKDTQPGELAGKKRELERAKIEQSRGGSVGWAVGGAAIGGVLGSLVPVIGTSIGIGLGAWAGKSLGDRLGNKRATEMEEKAKQKNMNSDLIESLGLNSTRTSALQGKVETKGGVGVVEFIGNADELSREEKVKALLTYKQSQNKTINDLTKEAGKDEGNILKNLIEQVSNLEKQEEAQDGIRKTALASYKSYQQTAQMMKVAADKAKEWHDNLKGVSDLFTTFASTSSTAGMLDSMSESADRYAAAIRKANVAQLNFIEAAQGPAMDKNQLAEWVAGMSGMGKADQEIKNLAESLVSLNKLNGEQAKSPDENRAKEIQKQKDLITQIIDKKIEDKVITKEVGDKIKETTTAYVDSNQAQLKGMEGQVRSKILLSDSANLIQQVNTNMTKVTKVNDVNVSLLKQQNELTDMQQQYVENLAVGMAPSFEMRKRVYELTHAERVQQEAGLKAVGEQLKVQALTVGSKKSLVQMGASEQDMQKIINGDMLTAKRIMDNANLTTQERGEAERALGAAMQPVMEKNKAIYGLKIKELELTKKIREGFLDVIDEMTTGNDLVSQLMPSAERGRMAVLDVTRMMSGSGFGGAMQVGFASTTMMPGTGAGGTPRYDKNGLQGSFASPVLDRYLRQTPGLNDPRESRFMSGVDVWKSNLGAAGIEPAPNMTGGTGDITALRDPLTQLSAQTGVEVSLLQQIAEILKTRLNMGMPANAAGAPGTTPQMPIVPAGGVPFLPQMPPPNKYGGGLLSLYGGSTGINMRQGGVFPGIANSGSRDDSFAFSPNGNPILVQKEEFYAPPKMAAKFGGALQAMNSRSYLGGGDLNYNNAMSDAQKSPVHFNLADGGFVVNRRATKENRGLLDSMLNNCYDGGELPSFAIGGYPIKRLKKWWNRVVNNRLEGKQNDNFLNLVTGRTAAAALGQHYDEGFGGVSELYEARKKVGLNPLLFLEDDMDNIKLSGASSAQEIKIASFLRKDRIKKEKEKEKEREIQERDRRALSDKSPFVLPNLPDYSIKHPPVVISPRVITREEIEQKRRELFHEKFKATKAKGDFVLVNGRAVSRRAMGSRGLMNELEDHRSNKYSLTFQQQAIESEKSREREEKQREATYRENYRKTGFGENGVVNLLDNRRDYDGNRIYTPITQDDIELSSREIYGNRNMGEGKDKKGRRIFSSDAQNSRDFYSSGLGEGKAQARDVYAERAAKGREAAELHGRGRNGRQSQWDKRARLAKEKRDGVSTVEKLPVRNFITEEDRALFSNMNPMTGAPSVEGNRVKSMDSPEFAQYMGKIIPDNSPESNPSFLTRGENAALSGVSASDYEAGRIVGEKRKKRRYDGGLIPGFVGGGYNEFANTNDVQSGGSSGAGSNGSDVGRIGGNIGRIGDGNGRINATVMPTNADIRQATILSTKNLGGFTSGDVSGLHQTASMSGGGMMPTAASMLLSGGFNIGKLYLGGKLMGGNLSSGPQYDLHDLQVSSRNS